MHSGSHLLVSVLTTVRPTGILDHPQLQNLYHMASASHLDHCSNEVRISWDCFSKKYSSPVPTLLA